MMETQSPQISSGLKIVVYEYVSGGGYAGQPLPPSVLAEGYAMLRSLVSDFKAAGHETTVLLDARLSKLNPPLDADCTIPIFYPEEPQRFIASIAKINDATYVIAPETEKTLQKIVEAVEQTGTISLNCKSKAISKVADKAVLYGRLQNMGFPTPKTLILNIEDSLETIMHAVKSEFSCPVVFKPVDGVGCSGLSLVKIQSQVELALTKIKSASTNKRFIIQEYIKGDSASVSLLSNGKKAVALSLNKQQVTVAEPDAHSSYDGGCVPLNHPRRDEAVCVSEKVAESFPGLQGYVGVDLILTEESVFAVDVNPRLTTSYVGLRKVAGFNVAEALINAIRKQALPQKIGNQGVACFSKLEVPKSPLHIFRQIAQLEEVISPPYSVEDSSDACVLLMGYGADLESARLRLEEAKKNLLNILC
jgi:tyramine---L-glutamate ligase